MDLFLMQIPQQIVNGVTLGSVYALLALGYSMVYGVLKMLNFAHGSVFMVGAFAGWGVLSWLARGNVLATNPALALLAMVAAGTAATALLGATIERLAYRPLRGGSRMAPLISALGVSIILENAAMLLTSGRAKTYQTELIFPQTWAVRGGGDYLRHAHRHASLVSGDHDNPGHGGVAHQVRAGHARDESGCRGG